MRNDQVLILDNVYKKYRLYRKNSDRVIEAINPFSKRTGHEFFAINGLSMSANKGDIIGIVGKNGSGKSTLLKLVAGITTPTSGTVSVQGKVIPLIELGSGFHPELTGKENIYFYTTVLGYKRKDIHFIVEKIIEFADIGEFIDQPLKMYSSGMKSRLAFSVSIFIDPDILIVDEILSVGDAGFQKKSYRKMLELFNSGKTILFVSHSPEDIKDLCKRAYLLENGRIILEGKPDVVVDSYLNRI